MKRNLMNELTEGIGALGTIAKYKKEMEEIEQILGKVLGYPWFKDDQCNFPNASEADGVAIGDHTAWSLAHQAAEMIKRLEKQIDEVLGISETIAESINQYKQLDEERIATIKKLQYELDIHNAKVHKLSLEEWKNFNQKNNKYFDEV